MTIHKRIALKDLIVNPNNDRHGPLMTEATAIEWLLINKTDKMKELLEDIAVRSGAVFEEPLVMKDGTTDEYIVYDGNRRITCLKLLYGLAPTDIKNPLHKRIETLKANNNLNPSPHVECRVETDIDVVNDILELRHTPGNSGAGQLKWDGLEKEIFLERTGRSKKLNFAREVNRLLIEANYLNAEDRIPLSNFNRLFSSKEMKRRVGVEVQHNGIQLINEREASYKALTRIAKDMIAGKITLDDVWDKNKKTLYLDDLEKEGMLPSAKDRLAKPEVVTDKDNGEISQKRKPPAGPHQRDYLLPTNLPTPEHGKHFSQKFCRLFYELQNTLRFSNHLIAVSISFRAFLEILTNSYLKTQGINESGKLSSKIKEAFGDMQHTDTMPEEAKAFVKKLADDNEYFSVNTLHKIVHNDMQVSENDLRAYVNNLDAYLRFSIEKINKKQTSE